MLTVSGLFQELEVVIDQRIVDLVALLDLGWVEDSHEIGAELAYLKRKKEEGFSFQDLSYLGRGSKQLVETHRRGCKYYDRYDEFENHIGYGCVEDDISSLIEKINDRASLVVRLETLWNEPYTMANAIELLVLLDQANNLEKLEASGAYGAFSLREARR